MEGGESGQEPAVDREKAGQTGTGGTRRRGRSVREEGGGAADCREGPPRDEKDKRKWREKKRGLPST